MKITVKQLRVLIREAVEEAMSCVDEEDKPDLNDDGENNFTDVQIARGIASGMSHKDAVKKFDKKK